jgi:ATP-binding protein involved in chromosome partitioning
MFHTYFKLTQEVFALEGYFKNRLVKNLFLRYGLFPMGKNRNGIVVDAPERPKGSPLAGVKHVIAVGSGKGGVGKSTTAVNLAMALKKLGAKVGLMDADIYGPSVPRLMGPGAAMPMQRDDGKVTAPMLHGIRVMSMALLGGDSPVVWRGPMASKAVSQFLSEVDWGELDYLIVDMPPGTGDVQITLSQAARLSGAIIVMTPQSLAADIAKRGLKMFQQVRVPVLGVVENMSEFICPHCNKSSHIFRSGGGNSVCEELKVPFLGSVPLDIKLVEESDLGTPVVLSRPESEVAKSYLSMAEKLATELEDVVYGERKSAPQIVSIDPNEKAKMAKIIWSDGVQSLISFKDFRYLCPCAVCVDEHTGERKIKRESVNDDVHPLNIRTVGNYAVQVKWSDSHDTGIYSFEYLRHCLTK